MEPDKNAALMHLKIAMQEVADSQLQVNSGNIKGVHEKLEDALKRLRQVEQALGR